MPAITAMSVPAAEPPLPSATVAPEVSVEPSASPKIVTKKIAPPAKSAEKPTKVENAPSASVSVSKGVGGIVETPPF
jgi:hypothetical protein